MPDRTLLDGARDAEEFLDHLDVSEIRVSGWSMGGPYALATAWLLGDRVQRAAVVAGNLPLDDPITMRELNAMDRHFTAMAGARPAELKLAAAVWGGLARFSPRTWAAVAAKGEGSLDEAAVRLAAKDLAASSVDAVRQGDGVVEEYIAWARPWEFALEAVATPVDVWQGTEDHLVPVEWAQRMAERLPAGHLHLLDGEGHFLLLNHAVDVLVSLSGDGGH